MNRSTMWYMPNTIRLIENYRNCPELWDPEHHSFKDREAKKASLKNLADDFGVDVLEIERKLKGLKTQFAREYLKQISGHRSTWFGFELLQFLLKAKKNNDIRDIIHNGEIRTGSSSTIPELNISIENDVESSNIENASFIVPEEININEPETNFSYSMKHPAGSSYPWRLSYPKRQRKYSSDDDMIDFRKVPAHSEEVTVERDEFTVFGEHVANKLRTITDPHARSVSQYYISNILFQAEMTNFDNNLKFCPPTDFRLFHSTDQ